MTNEEIVLKEILEQVNAHPESERIKLLASSFRASLIYGGEAAKLALALVGAELATE